MRRLSAPLEAEDLFEEIHTMIGALLGTREYPLETSTGQARREGVPFDPSRMELFHKLHAALRSTALPPPRLMGPKRINAPALTFFEAYFSNFIEGTEFDVDDAADIIFNGKIPVQRPADAHDILGTFRTVSDLAEMQHRPKNAEELLELLKRRHATIMSGRPDKSPGTFKTESNRAGTSIFVSPELVVGTFIKAFPLYQSLEAAFQWAVFMMFLISEVHPFTDGNGRVARVMMRPVEAWRWITPMQLRS
ncbi:MAG: filamentation induced by cAMP protein Fic [Puniceicoccaceae bacterium 5H]|nr:MAG: filamentation induced by cAMP protein Fic [Puniceicoccaceae bacterium 5H]